MIIYDFPCFSFLFFSSVQIHLQESDGEKSDQDLVVDIANETVSFEPKTSSKNKKLN